MFLKCCLLHKDIVLPRHAIFSIFISVSMSWSIYILFMWSILPLSFSFSLQLTINSHWYRQTCFLDMFVKISASRQCLVFAYFFANFSLALLIKVLLIKKQVMLFDISKILSKSSVTQIQLANKPRKYQNK